MKAMGVISVDLQLCRAVTATPMEALAPWGIMRSSGQLPYPIPLPGIEASILMTMEFSDSLHLKAMGFRCDVSKILLSEKDQTL